ncbi:MAG: hypothetical protein JW841_16360 [Deltaproteobacteria bacterium]|nr:hypothetical protein [Deltaproteobacteria bacterium]
MANAIGNEIKDVNLLINALSINAKALHNDADIKAAEVNTDALIVQINELTASLDGVGINTKELLQYIKQFSVNINSIQQQISVQNEKNLRYESEINATHDAYGDFASLAPNPNKLIQKLDYANKLLAKLEYRYKVEQQIDSNMVINDNLLEYIDKIGTGVDSANSYSDLAKRALDNYNTNLAGINVRSNNNFNVSGANDKYIIDDNVAVLKKMEGELVQAYGLIKLLNQELGKFHQETVANYLTNLNHILTNSEKQLEEILSAQPPDTKNESLKRQVNVCMSKINMLRMGIETAYDIRVGDSSSEFANK